MEVKIGQDKISHNAPCYKFYKIYKYRFKTNTFKIVSSLLVHIHLIFTRLTKDLNPQCIAKFIYFDLSKLLPLQKIYFFYFFLYVTSNNPTMTAAEDI